MGRKNKKDKKNKRRRPTSAQVRDNAAKGARGGNDWFKLPEGVGRYAPEKAARVNIDILQYVIETDTHPDGIEAGMMWYKYPFAVHHQVGPSSKSVVCPRSKDQRCPICEEKDKLAKDGYDKNEKAIKKLSPQNYVAYNIIDPEDSTKVAIFCMSRGKFAVKLEEEIKEPDNADDVLFFDCNENGRTLRTRFTMLDYEGRKYLGATRIDFKKRPELDEDEVIESTVCLENALLVPTYDEVKAIFFQGEDDDDDDSADEATTEVDDDDDDDDNSSDDDDDNSSDDDDDDDDDDEKPECPECEKEYDSDDAVHSDTLDKDFCSKKCLRRAEKTAAKKKDKKDKKEKDKKDKKNDKKKDKKNGKKKKCPGGGKFGKDVDKLEKCDNCDLWDDCEEANSAK